MKHLRLEQWKFRLGEEPGAWYKGFEDGDWEDVTVPHDWSVSQPFSRDNSSGTGYLPGGTGWYRIRFRLPQEGPLDTVLAAFDGVYKNSQVWCNSTYLGKRPSGYASFVYDISHCVDRKGENVLAVRVEHEDISDSRWFTGSGIHRKVEILTGGRVWSKPGDLFFHTPAVSRERAEVVLEDRIRNAGAEPAEGTAQYTLTGPEGGEVLRLEQPFAIPAGDSVAVNLSGAVSQPELWSCGHPALYTLTARIQTADGSLLEEKSLAVGIRECRFDPDRGFFLNGQPMKLKGVCVHHDGGCLGAAVWPQVWERRLEKLRDMGCNAIRMSHNPHMPELYDLCDRMGFLVIDEAFDEWEGAKNKWSTGHNVYPPMHQGYFEEFPQWHRADLTALVKGNRNHPCVILWSIGNEIDYPNDPYCHPLFTEMTGNNDANKPDAERRYDPNKPDAGRIPLLAGKLADIVRTLDPTRPVTAAVAFPELSTKIGYLDQLDVVGYNYKEQWYEQDHALFPTKPFLGSENSHSLEAWDAVRNNDYVAGQFLWTGVDFLGEAQGWPVHGSAAGLLNLAGFEKEDYYHRQALWSREPVLRLATSRAGEAEDRFHPLQRKWDYLPGEPVRVVCHTNLDQAELFCNGKSLGKGFRSEQGDRIVWEVPYQQGALEVRGSWAGKGVRDLLETTGKAVQISLSLWTPAEDWSRELASQSGWELLQVEARLLDGAERLDTAADHLLSVQVTGGKLLGLENGNLADNTPYREPARRAHEGRLLILVLALRERDPGQIQIQVTGGGLQPEAITL